jgi:hypothetical protein
VRRPIWNNWWKRVSLPRFTAPHQCLDAVHTATARMRVSMSQHHLSASPNDLEVQGRRRVRRAHLSVMTLHHAVRKREVRQTWVDGIGGCRINHATRWFSANRRNSCGCPKQGSVRDWDAGP